MEAYRLWYIGVENFKSDKFEEATRYRLYSQIRYFKFSSPSYPKTRSNKKLHNTLRICFPEAARNGKGKLR